MKVGDLVKSILVCVGFNVGTNPLDDRPMVLWSHLPFVYPESTSRLELINESR